MAIELVSQYPRPGSGWQRRGTQALRSVELRRAVIAAEIVSGTVSRASVSITGPHYALGVQRQRNLDDSEGQPSALEFYDVSLS